MEKKIWFEVFEKNNQDGSTFTIAEFNTEQECIDYINSADSVLYYDKWTTDEVGSPIQLI